MRYLISAMLLIAGIIHLLPLPGVLGSETLAKLYGVTVADSNLLIMMRHRALLFGLLGLFMVLAAFRPAYQPLAFIAGYCSVISFLWIAWSTGHYNAQVARVFTADIIALACLLIGTAAYFLTRSKHGH